MHNFHMLEFEFSFDSISILISANGFGRFPISCMRLITDNNEIDHFLLKNCAMISSRRELCENCSLPLVSEELKHVTNRS